MVECNLELGMPTVAEAMHNLKMICAAEKAAGCKVLVVIHGYGSSGKGGAIRVKVREWLNSQVRKGQIQAAVNGEDFGMFSLAAQKIKDIDSNTVKYYGRKNPGVTIVLL